MGKWGFISVVGRIVSLNFIQETGSWIGIFRIRTDRLFQINT
jgi:hypothetical protein